MKKVLLTGGSGFVGRNVIEHYANSDKYEIIAPTSKELNCIDQEAVYTYLKNNRFDYIFNFAVYGDGLDKSKDPTKMLEYNLRMYLNFAKYSDMYDRMIYLGSGAEFNKQFPICSVKEEDVGKIIPSEHYGLMKYTVNRMIEKSDNIYNFRLFGIFGKYEPFNRFISNVCIKSIFDLPLTMRQNVYFDYLFIDDFLKILDKFLELDAPNYHSYNIVSGKRVDLQSICLLINKLTNKEHRIIICKEGLGNEYTASNERICNEIDIKYTPFEESVKWLYNYYESIKSEIDIGRLLY